jgi:hypothetical protein
LVDDFCTLDALTVSLMHTACTERPRILSPLSAWMIALPSSAGYDLAPIVIDNAAFSYQSSDLKTVCRLAVLRATPFVFLDRELGDLRSNFGDASAFTTAKYLLAPRTKHPPEQTALY